MLDVPLRVCVHRCCFFFFGRGGGGGAGRARGMCYHGPVLEHVQVPGVTFKYLRGLRTGVSYRQYPYSAGTGRTSTNRV